MVNNKVFDELEFTIRRGDFEKAEQMIESFKKQYAPGCEEYGEICCYELLTHYKATTVYELKYFFSHNFISVDECKYCQAVKKYSDPNERSWILTLLALRLYTSLIEQKYRYNEYAELCIKKKEYKKAIEFFLQVNNKKQAIDTALTASRAALKKNHFDEALQYLNYVLFDDACYEEYKKVKKYEQAYLKFQQEIGSPQKYAAEVLKKANKAKYLKYLKLSTRSGGYTDGVLHFIAVFVAWVVSCLMLFDPDLDIPALYVIWGICASIALHKKYMWDFGIIKSIGGTFLLCAAPALATAFAYEVLDADGLGAIITIAVTLIEFIPTLVRNIKYMNNSKAGKKKIALRTQFIEPTLGTARRQLAEKYAPLTDHVTATTWANTIKF